MRNILIINSSFRKKSNSTTLSNAVAKGATQKGHTVTTLDIAKKEIKPCRGCLSCRKEGATTCIIQDDMLDYYPLVQKADILIFTSPIYWFNMGGQIKQFVDRCFAIAVESDGETSTFRNKTFGAVFAYADSDPVISGCINAIRTFQDMCAYTGATWAGAVYGAAHEAGEMETNHELLKKAEDFGANL